MQLSARMWLFGLILGGIIEAKQTAYERAQHIFEKKYIFELADFRNISVKNQATKEIKQFFMEYDFYKVAVYKRLLRDYKKYKLASKDIQNSPSLIDEFVLMIQKLRPEIMGIMLYEDLQEQYVVPFQKHGLMGIERGYKNKESIGIFTQRMKILVKFMQDYRPYISASLLLSLQELQKQCMEIKASLEKSYGIVFVKKCANKYDKKIRIKRFFAKLGIVIGIAFIAIPFLLVIDALRGEMGAGMALALGLPMWVAILIVGINLEVYAIRYLRETQHIVDYEDWNYFIV